MKVLLLVLSMILLQGCASGPISKANALYFDYGGLRYLPDYEVGKFADGETLPIKDGKIKRPFAKRLGVNHEDHHAIFGHFPRRENEAEGGSAGNISRKELFYFLEPRIKQTIKDLEFEITLEDTVLAGPFSVTTFVLVNDSVGCRKEDECRIVMKTTVAHIGHGEIGFRGTSWGNASNKDRFIDVQHTSFIIFGANEKSSFDQRIFYKKLSENLPSTMYLYLNAVDSAFVQVSPGKVVAYPYLLNKGEVLKFEFQTNKDS